jgi:phenylalanyl-tRNA synthetase beta chain
MILSLAWIFDHIDADWKKQDIDLIFSRFNAVTAEIEHVHKLSFDLSGFALCKVLGQSDTGFSVSIPAWSKNNTILPVRSDALNVSFDLYYVVKLEGDDIRWATLADFNVDKAGLMPALDATDGDLDGSWKQKFESEDILLEVDNKSITHRPDMWGHRGFAREIAAFLDLPFKDASHFLVDHPLHAFEKSSKETNSTPIVIENHATTICSRFTGLYFSSIENKPSNIFIASRLIKVGNRPISGIVDLTNYLTHDWSQPVHAYDAEKIKGNRIIVRMAQDQERLTLLDGNEISLTTEDLVVANAQRPMGLAGVKGGLDSGIDASTKSIFFESATFDAGSVRRSAMRHKTRTDSSARYEKTLDPLQASDAVKRFLKLLSDCNIIATYAEEIIVVGKEVPDMIIEIDHDFLENRSGLSLSENDVIEPLTKLGFKVLRSAAPFHERVYMVSVPSFRATKDVKIKEDILEEVVRCYGFGRIPHHLPLIESKPFSFSWVKRQRELKRYCAYVLHMTEQQNYSMYDEVNLADLGLQMPETVDVINPISQHFRRMVYSLIPGLLKNIKENHVHREFLAFFEFARVWRRRDLEVFEHKNLAGVFFSKNKSVDFYQHKAQVTGIFESLGFAADQFVWRKTTAPQQSWYSQHQTAEIVYQDRVVGIAGCADGVILAKIADTQNSAFIFELDGDFLLNETVPDVRMKKISKFQDTFVDLSLMVPLKVPADQLTAAFSGLDDLIYKIELIDFFEKEEWDNVRSLTFRLWLNHPEKTLEKDEIDAVWQKAVVAVQKYDVQLRT